jgi:hypothetical protein
MSKSVVGDHITYLVVFGKGCGRRPARFASDASMARRDAAQATGDPEGRFWPWMGRL